jgi:hypothetical protein
VAATDYAAVGAIGSSGLTMSTARLLGRTTASAGAVEELTAAQAAALIQVGQYTPGYISRSALLEYVSASSVRLAAGSAKVNGTLLTWGSAITWSGSSGTAPLDTTGVKYAYLYDSGGGAAALEWSTTAPAYASGTDEYQKTGDATRRYVGWIVVLDSAGTKKVCRFHYRADSGSRVIVAQYAPDGFTVADLRVLNNVASVDAWAAVACSAFLPSLANVATVRVAVGKSSETAETGVGLSAYDLTSQGILAGSRLFRQYTSSSFSDAMFEIMVAGTTFYYRAQRFSGTGTVFMDVLGAETPR